MYKNFLNATNIKNFFQTKKGERIPFFVAASHATHLLLPVTGMEGLPVEAPCRVCAEAWMLLADGGVPPLLTVEGAKPVDR
jgi:hypothetical protein